MNSTVSAELRRELQRITDRQLGPSHAFRRAIDRLAKTHPHSISFVEDGSNGPHGYNCFMYALGLRQLPEVLAAIARRVDAAYPGSAFVEQLLGTHLRCIDDADAREGSVAIYFDDPRRPQHAGILTGNGLVVSKWGRGHVWRHPVFEVPSSYGDVVRFYVPPDRETILRQFTAYVERVTGNRVIIEEPNP